MLQGFLRSSVEQLGVNHILKVGRICREILQNGPNYFASSTKNQYHVLNPGNPIGLTVDLVYADEHLQRYSMLRTLPSNLRRSRHIFFGSCPLCLPGHRRYH